MVSLRKRPKISLIIMQQLAQMILLLSIIMHQYGVLVLLARLSDGQGLTILPFFIRLPVHASFCFRTSNVAIRDRFFLSWNMKENFERISQTWNRFCMNEQRLFTKLTGLQTSGFLSSQLTLLPGTSWMRFRIGFKGSFNWSAYADFDCLNE